MRTASPYWFKGHHGTACDPKFRVVAKRCAQPVAIVIAVWACLLEQASAAPERGTIADLDVEEVAVTLDLETDVVAACVTAMEGKVLDGRHVTAWERQQAGSVTSRVTSQVTDDVTGVTKEGGDGVTRASRRAGPLSGAERQRRYRERVQQQGAREKNDSISGCYQSSPGCDETRGDEDVTSRDVT